MNKEPARSYYTRKSIIHHGLEVISRMPMTETEWRTKTKNISIERFFMYVINPLKKDGFVVNRDGRWRITNDGESRLLWLGPYVDSPHPGKPTQKTPIQFEPYDGSELKKKFDREGAGDFLNFPSRVNNRLYFKDGRVEVMA